MVRAHILAVLALGYVLAVAGGGVAQSEVDVSGPWTGTWESSDDGSTGRFEVRFVQSGQQLSGSIRVTNSPDIRSGTVAGTIKAGRVTFGAISGGATIITFTGIFSARSGRGEYHTGRGDYGTWSAVR